MRNRAGGIKITVAQRFPSEDHAPLKCSWLMVGKNLNQQHHEFRYFDSELVGRGFNKSWLVSSRCPFELPCCAPTKKIEWDYIHRQKAQKGPKLIK